MQTEMLQSFWLLGNSVTKRIFTKVSKSTWLITELANQRARKALFTCVVYTHTPRPRLKCFSKLATSKKTIDIMNLKLFLYELFQWYSHANKIQIHKKGFALSLVLKVRVFVTQKRTKNTAAKRLRILRVEHFPSCLSLNVFKLRALFGKRQLTIAL